MGSQYHLDNLTMKFIILACLAVSPVDTYSVQAARAAHLTAKANAYNFRPYTYAAYPYNYGAHYLYKRDAEADPQYFYGNYYGAYNRGYYNYPTYSTYNYGAYPYASNFYGNRFLYKREAEAEAEADPQYYLGNYYGAYNRGYYNYPSRPYYGYRTYGYPYAY